MTPSYSAIDSDQVALGDLADYSITSSAIPVDVGDSSGAITSFTTKQTVAHNDLRSPYYAIDQQLTLTTEQGNTVEGRITSVGTPAKGVMSLTADTAMSDLAVDRRVYPIYRSGGIPRHIVGAALDHWTQAAGMFYDKVPGKVSTYHSFYGHDYVYSTRPENRPRLQTNSSLGLDYRVDGERVVFELRPGDVNTLTPASVQPAGTLIAATESLPIPSAASGEALVLSPAFVVGASGQSGTMIWYFSSARADQIGAQAVNVELRWSTTSGFALQLAHPANSSRVTMAAPSGELTPGHRYRVLVAIYEHASAGNTVFQMRVINETAGSYTDTASYIATPLHGSQVQLNYAAITAAASGTGTKWATYGYFASTMRLGGMPFATLPTAKAFGVSPKEVEFLPGFDGDIWSNIKTMLALYRMDLWYENGRLCAGVRQARTVNIPVLSNVQKTITQREAARYIEVVNQNMKAFTTVPEVFFAADSVYQVATGEVDTFTVQTEHSIDTLNNPQCVSGISPYPYKQGVGQYVITGSDGYIVSPSWWKANGGSLTVRTTEKEGEIEITLKGPDFESPRSPYRVSEGDAGRAALYITGTGVAGAPETLKIPTGNPKAATEVGETVDIPFITNRGLAYQAAVQVSLRYASPLLKLSGVEPKEPGFEAVLSKRGAGTLIEYDGNIYRIGSITETGRSISFSEAVQYNTNLLHQQTYLRTIRKANEANAGRTIKDAALKTLEQY